MFREYTHAQTRQAIDAEATFAAWRQARHELAQVRGSMFWRETGGREYLIRRNTRGRQTSLGPRSPQTSEIFERFTQRKTQAQLRARSLREQIETDRRVSRALSIGTVPPVVVAILNALDDAGLASDFRVVGTHALFAYAAAARVQLRSEDTATRDVDLLFDMRHRLRFVRTMAGAGQSLLSVIQRADSTFTLRSDQAYTATNAQGFEVDVIRRGAVGDDPHPLRMSDDEGDFWAVQVGTGAAMQDGELMEQPVFATDGSIAVMRTIAPAAFCRVKRAIARASGRDPGKARRDLLQSELVEMLVAQYLPHLAPRLA